MPYEVAIPAIQTALIDLLEADAALTAIIRTKPSARGGGPAIYDDGDVAQGQVPPYMTIGAWTQVQDHTFSPESSGQSGYGWNCTAVLKIISQRVDKTFEAMSAAVGVLFDGRALTVSGYDSAYVFEFNLQPMIKTTLAGLTTYELPGILRVRVHDS